MATIKSYTDIEQSKKLVEILPIESADGFWEYHNKWYSECDEWEGYEDYPRAEPYLEYTRKENEWKEDKSDIPCWSLAALLDVIPKRIKYYNVLRIDISENEFAIWYDEIAYGVNNDLPDITKDNPVDACVAMIEKLHELKML